eukprot:113362-Pyramimonas_sp.AAC.1
MRTRDARLVEVDGMLENHMDFLKVRRISAWRREDARACTSSHYCCNFTCAIHVVNMMRCFAKP